MKKESNGTTIVKNFMKSQGSVFIILLVMCIIASIFTDKFLSVSNLSNVLTQSVTCGIAAIGMTFVILTGGIDLSVGGCIVFSATIGTKLLSEGKVGVGTAIIIMLLLGVLVGVFNGFLITVLKMPAFIATLASSNVTAGLALYISMGKTIIVIGGASMSGGEGSVVGTIVGALILTIISNAMNLMSVNAYLQQVVMGLIIIMAILFDMVRKGYIFRKPDEE